MLHLRILFQSFLFLAIVFQVNAKEPPAPSIYHYHEDVSDDVWSSVAPYLLPQNDKLKIKLDKIFKKRASGGMSSLKKAGFTNIIHQKWTRLIVAKHPDLKGYIVKLYLDRQHYHRGIPEHYFWIRRCMGSEIIRTEINQNNWQKLFKVPRKWIYPLPPTPLPTRDGPAKHFILVEDDMDIYPQDRNNHLWGSRHVTKELLDALFYIIQKHGFYDCAKPDNIPFSKDGRIAFVDTQSFHRWPVAFDKLVWYLQPKMAEYWLTKVNELQQ